MAITITGYTAPAQAGAWVGISGTGLKEAVYATVSDSEIAGASIQPESDEYLYVYLEGTLAAGDHTIELWDNDSIKTPVVVSVVAAETPVEEPAPVITAVEPQTFPEGPVTLTFTGTGLTTVHSAYVWNRRYYNIESVSDTCVKVHLEESFEGTHDIGLETVAQRQSPDDLSITVTAA